MSWKDPINWLIDIVGAPLAGLILNVLRKLTAGPSEALLRPRRLDDLRLVFTSVPREPVTPSATQPNPEFNYLAGPNEVDFAWTLYPILKRLVPPGKRLHPITFSRQMYIGGVNTIPTANTGMWATNLLVSGSTKFNEVTRQLHSEYSQLPVQLIFPQEGGSIIDKRKDNKRYTPERKDGEITSDYGIFAKYWNPFDRSKTIILVAGVESVYQLGITRTLMNRTEANHFLRALEHQFGGKLPPYFEVLIRAPGRGLEFTGPLQIIEAYRLPEE